MKKVAKPVLFLLLVVFCGCDFDFGPIFPADDSGQDYEYVPDYSRWEGAWRFTLSEPFATMAGDTAIVRFDTNGTGTGRFDLEVGGDPCPFGLTLHLNSLGYLQNPSRCLRTMADNTGVSILGSGFWMSGPFVASGNSGTYTVLYVLAAAGEDTVFARGNWSAHPLITP